MQNSLSRRDILRLSGSAAAVALTPAALLAQRGADGKPLKSPVPAFDNDLMSIKTIGENLDVLSGLGGNVLLFAHHEHTLIVDTGVPSRGEELLEMVKAKAKGRTRTVINTHFHFDHTGGNEAFGHAGATIISHEQTRVRLGIEQTLELINLKVPASPEIAFPTITFDNSLTLYPGTAIKLTHVEPAHTDTDSIVHFEYLDVIHMGDLWFNGVYPLIDYSSKGWLGGYIAAIDKALDMAGNKTKIIPGHGAVGGKVELTEFRDMLAKVYENITRQIDKGLDENAVIATKPTAEFDSKWGKGLLDGPTFTFDAVRSVFRHKAMAAAIK